MPKATQHGQKVDRRSRFARFMRRKSIPAVLTDRPLRSKKVEVLLDVSHLKFSYRLGTVFDTLHYADPKDDQVMVRLITTPILVSTRWATYQTRGKESLEVLLNHRKGKEELIVDQGEYAVCPLNGFFRVILRLTHMDICLYFVRLFSAEVLLPMRRYLVI